eukprot:TRINITY_DN68230_c0_g1_i1.p1 TRINITY_DN68230_c0_g1~~TRINITY_DN68230_c0_g1_i1.p1  ORF type:complete len:461 (-),score=50.33 TRINITY_DN68230_c0_g1_i1:49-1431(-)
MTTASVGRYCSQHRLERCMIVVPNWRLRPDIVILLVVSTCTLRADSFSDLMADMQAVTVEVANYGVDRPKVNVHVGGRSVGPASMSQWRFEGYVDPRAYFTPQGTLRTMRSPWAESPEDVREAMKWVDQNKTKMRAVVGWKRRKFRLGRAVEFGTHAPSYFRAVALNASSFLAQIRDAGVPLSGSYVNFGAADGVNDDPLYAVALEFSPEATPKRARHRSFAGVGVGDSALAPQFAVEADPDLCAKHRQNLPWVQLACTSVTPQNTKSLLASAFPSSEHREALDVLKLDIDSFEAFVLEECLWRSGLKPKLILIEFNAGIPPPFQYALHYSPQFRAAYQSVALSFGKGQGDPLEVNAPIAGVSLSYLVRMLEPEYFLLSLGSPDAIFARRDVLERLGRFPVDEFKAFEQSWVDVHGFSRKQLRRWYFETDEVDALGEIHDHLTAWMQRYLGAVLPFVLTH